jgi:hypothetical protein
LFCWYWWNCWPALFTLSFVLLILVELLTSTVYTFFECKQCWTTIPPISKKQKKV